MSQVHNESLRDDVLAELDLDPQIEAQRIGVIAEDGVVTLTGSVASFAEKWAAEEAAKRVKGVRAVAERLDVDLPAMHVRDDTDIAHEVTNAIAWNVTLPSDIRAVVEEGHVTLEGTVDWYYQRERAAETVRNLRGVRGVTNYIALRPRISPENVEATIKRAFHRQAQLDADTIDVRVVGGRVILSGKVHGWFERSEAVQAAWSVPGVTEVDNKLALV
ncbi:MAG: BON domain-containing protein [Candidatus Eremiobacteraeota bacterium]|nr:BON domain-containing protein [Candidatus Eremiobacteraeota bacterium]NNM92006.1 BON domain-containing protein [Candidatus Eremiobacteraeota bacterium]